MSEYPVVCPECGENKSDGQTCADAFHVLLAWEWEFEMQDVHHLLVLCYHLQHPSLYSPDGLKSALELLIAFVEAEMSPQEMRRQIWQRINSGQRDFKITARPDAHGIYAKPVLWEMRVWDCVRAGHENYYRIVRTWSESVFSPLKASGNLAGISTHGMFK
jgi:hypothetical protein